MIFNIFVSIYACMDIDMKVRKRNRNDLPDSLTIYAYFFNKRRLTKGPSIKYVRS